MSIKSKSLNLQATKEKFLLERLDNLYKAGVIKSPEEYEKAKGQIDSSSLATPSFVIRKQDNLTQAQPINQSFQELTIDLNVIFRHLDMLDQSISRHQKLRQGAIENLSTDLKEIEGTLSKVEKTIDNQGRQRSLKESFRNSFNQEKDPAFLKDRDGTVLSTAWIDQEYEVLKLPLLAQKNCLVSIAGKSMAHIGILRQVGAELVEDTNPETAMDKAIDTSMDTYWYCSILADEPIRVPIDQFNIQEGIPVVLEIILSEASLVNHIDISPFCQLPIDIVAILAYSSDDTSQEPIEIVSPNHYIPELKSTTSNENLVFYFQEIPIKRLHLVLNQRHYIQRDFITSSLEEKRRQSLFAIEPTGYDPKLINYPLYKTICEEEPLWPVFQQNVGKIVTDIEKVMVDQEKDIRTSVTKYHYEMGLYNIGVKHDKFYPACAYVSKPMALGGIIKDIKISDKVTMPRLFNSELFDTQPGGIEYSIVVENGTEYPIVPVNKEVINNELLIPRELYIKGQRVYGCPLRVAYKSIKAIKENGYALKLYSDYKIVNNVIVISNWKSGSIYTIDYIPADLAYTVEFTGQAQIVTETFYGTDNTGKIKLSQYHYVDREAILSHYNTGWSPSYFNSDLVPAAVEIRMADGTIINQPQKEGDSISMANITDYIWGYSGLEEFNGGNYQYLIRGKDLRFNTILPRDAAITVTYMYQVDSIRVKAILRRTIQNQIGVTPVLHEYTIMANLFENR